MKTPLSQRLDLLARNLSPFAFSVVLLILGAAPLPVPHLAAIGPSFAMAAVFYWAVHRPTLLPAPAVFVIGVLSDFLGGAPVGVGAVTLLLVHGVAVAQRRLLLETPFVVLWWGYSMVAAGATVVTWLLSSWLADAMIDPRPALFSFLLDLGVFPAVAYVFARAQRSVLRRG